MELKRVVRLDSIPLDSTYYTEEGYLIDIPIVTTCGIFEYKNEDGSIRRELRRPEDVFAEDSLASYEGKPVVITHHSGGITKDNVAKEQIGTIISKGMRDGNHVRAKIIIHNTDQMLRCGLRELSLGYSLTTEDSPGVWQGKPYDCIQHDIEINHLALVQEARAGNSARLNIDGKDSDVEGGAAMEGNKTIQNGLSPEELEEAIALYQSHKSAEAWIDGGEKEPKTPDPQAKGIGTSDPKEKKPEKPSVPAADAGQANQKSLADKIRAHMKQLEEDGISADPAGVVAQLKGDVSALLDECDKLSASKDMEMDTKGTASGEALEPGATEKKNNTDGKEAFHMDTIDAMVSEKLDVCRVAEKLRLDGVENIPVMEGRKKVIAAVHPKINLDGRSDTYINAAYDIARQAVLERKSTDGQRRQILGEGHIQHMDSQEMCSADLKRAEMINGMLGGV